MAIVNRAPLKWYERIYLPEILRGLQVTTQHFVRNLTLHTLHRFGLFRRIPASVTVQYPEQQRHYASRLRTSHRLTKREDGTPRCVACMLCETICPARCIAIVAGEHPNPDIEKYPVEFTIDLGKCVYCGYCVEVCPEDAIRMDTQRMDIAASSRQAMIYTVDRLLQ